MAWKKTHECDPFPNLNRGWTDGDTLECDKCKKVIMYCYDPTPVKTPITTYDGTHYWKTVKKGSF